MSDHAAATRTTLALRDARGVSALWRALDDIRVGYVVAVALLAADRRYRRLYSKAAAPSAEVTDSLCP